MQIVSVPDMANCGPAIAQADRKCEGKLRQDEFHSLMAQLMKLPAGQELPDKKKKELWIAATQGWRKVLDLDAFLAFYVTFV